MRTTRRTIIEVGRWRAVGWDIFINKNYPYGEEVREPQRDGKGHCIIYMYIQIRVRGRRACCCYTAILQINISLHHHHLGQAYIYIYIGGTVLTLSSFSGSRKSPFYLALSKMCVRPGNWPKRCHTCCGYCF